MAEPWPEGLLQRLLPMPPPKGWTPVQWRQLCIGASDGDSYSVIAAKTGLSKNAIVGIAHRRGFPGRPSPIQSSAAVTAERVHADPRDRIVKPPPAPRPVAVTPVVRRPVPAPTIAPFKAPRDGRGCRFPIGDPLAPDFRFCAAAEVITGSCYCPQHHALCYTRTAAEVQRAAEVARQVVGTPDHRPYVAPRAA